jgi:hypothetical protein
VKSVKIATEGGPGGAKIVNADTGQPIHGVKSAAINIDHEGATAVLELFLVQVEIRAPTRYQMIDPSAGDFRDVAAVIWADGGRTDLD